MPISQFPFFYNPKYFNRPNTVNTSYFRNPISHNSTQKRNSYINSKISNQSIKTEEIRNLNNPDYKKNNSKSSINQDSCFFELFGLKLYFDDILLICLIFFLYQEGVKDDELFISLILLLLS